jgi:hypothetical protein
MKGAKGFCLAEKHDAPEELPVPASETLVGWYVEPSEGQEPTLVFTDRALYIANEAGFDAIEWERFVSVVVPTKEAPKGLDAETTSGLVFIPIAGGHQPERNAIDAFSLMNVLRGMTS